MIEKCKRLERQLRETPGPEFAGMLPQFEGQAELQDACLHESTRVSQRTQYFSRDKSSTQTRDKILSRPNFVPH